MLRLWWHSSNCSIRHFQGSWAPCGYLWIPPQTMCTNLLYKNMYIILCFCKMFLATCQTNWMVAVTSKSGFYCPVATFPTTIHQNNRKVVFMVRRQLFSATTHQNNRNVVFMVPRQPFFHKLNSRITISLWIIQEKNVLLLLIIKMIYVFKILC